MSDVQAREAEPPTPLGRLVLVAMKRQGQTPADLARQAKISAAQVSRILNGERGPEIKLLTAHKLAAALAIPLQSIIDALESGRGKSVITPLGLSDFSDLKRRLATVEAQAALLLPLGEQTERIRQAALTLVGAIELPLETRRTILIQLEPGQSGPS